MNMLARFCTGGEGPLGYDYSFVFDLYGTAFTSAIPFGRVSSESRGLTGMICDNGLAASAMSKRYLRASRGIKWFARPVVALQ
jgi:hypothetical protein